MHNGPHLPWKVQDEDKKHSRDAVTIRYARTYLA
jgi:hypothetical protein